MEELHSIVVCSLFSKNTNPDFGHLTAGYHQFVANQFTMQSGHYQTDRIDWTETRKIPQTFHDDEQALILKH